MNCYNKNTKTRKQHLKKAGESMPTEKELNVHLLDKLDLLERLEMADSEGGYEKIKRQLAFKRNVLSANYISSLR